MLTVLREVVVWFAFLAACVYLFMYWQLPGRTRTVVSNMLLHLGTVQVLVYGGTLLRFYVFPVVDLPEWAESLTSATISLLAMSLTLWVLIAFLHTRHQAKKLDIETETEWSEDAEHH